MNKKIRKMLSITLPAFLFTNNMSFTKANNNLWWLPVAAVPAFGVPLTIAYLVKKSNDKNSLPDNVTLDSYINKNLVYSPLSLNAALIMAANGTSNPEVRQNISHYMGFTSLEEANGWLEKIMNTEINGVNIANSMWCTDLLRNIDKNKYTKFKQIIANKLKSKVGSIDINNGHNQINNWISQKTNGKIPSVFDKLDSSTLLVLVNTIYFNSKFVKKFEDEGLIKFNGIDTTTENVPTVKDQEGGSRNCDYCATNDYQAVRIPFEENGCYLYMVLPKTNNEFDKVKNIDVKEIAKNMKPKNVYLEIPRFKIESSLNLNDYCNNNNLLKTLMDVKLDNIHPKAKISKIVEKVVFEITPEGVEAAAASGEECVKECFVEPKIPEAEMIFDHAFIGFITDKKNNVLFKVNVKNIDGVERVNLKTGECTEYESNANFYKDSNVDEDDDEYNDESEYSRAIVKTDA